MSDKLQFVVRVAGRRPADARLVPIRAERFNQSVLQFVEVSSIDFSL